jgi:S1-C subfamily serine protease
VTLEFVISGGARDGDREVHDKPVVTIGRHPLSDVRFDAERDRDVSARHAEIRVEDGRALLLDAGSTNGTFVNGRRITGPTALASGDDVRFGTDGPSVRVTVGETWATRASRPATPPASRPAPAAPPAAAATSAPKPAGGTQERVRVAVRQETRKLSWIYGAGVLVVAAVGGGAWFTQKQAADARAAELSAMLARQDSLTAQFDAQLSRMSAHVGGLDSALLSAKQAGSSLRAQLAAGGGADVRSRLMAVQDRQQRILSAAQMDYSAVAAKSGKAVVLIAVEMPDGQVFSGSGFSVNGRGLVVTNRHLLRADDGTMAKRVAVIFSDTREWLPAKVVKVTDGDDLGFLQLDVGTYPAVAGVGDAPGPSVGVPVAIIGYPLGTETPMEGSGTKITARSTLGAGTVSKVLANVLQVDAYAGQGSSGSPVFDASGRVVGVVYGGATESAGRIVYAVPVARLLRELP